MSLNIPVKLVSFPKDAACALESAARPSLPFTPLLAKSTKAALVCELETPFIALPFESVIFERATPIPLSCRLAVCAAPAALFFAIDVVVGVKTFFILLFRPPPPPLLFAH